MCRVDFMLGTEHVHAGHCQVGPLLRRGRLVLVVDLDHTLLASARFGELTADTEAQLVS